MVSICSFQLFFICQRMTVINRAVLNTPKSIFESSIPLVREDEDPNLYFDVELLRDNLTSYYDKCIKPYSMEYTMKLYFHVPGTEFMCMMNTCQAVKVTVSAKVVFDLTYSRSIDYKIQKN